MNARPSPLRDNLRAVDEHRATLQTALIAALNHRLVDNLQTTARLASERDRRAATAWIQFRACPHIVQIAPLLVNRALARMSGAQGRPDAAGAAAALARIEPLIAALELVLGRELHPAGLQTGVRDDMVLLRLDATAAGDVILHRLLIAIPVDMAMVPIALPAVLPTALAGLTLRWAGWLPGPAIPPARLAHLGRGDLIMLGTAALDMRLSLPGRNDTPRARVDLQQGVLILQEDPDMAAPIQPPADAIDPPPVPPAGTRPTGNGPTGNGAASWDDLRVPTTIELTGSGLTAAELATLGKGSVLPLPAPRDTLTVRVIAGGKMVAEGELVAVGQGFGVLVTGLPSDRAE